MNRGIGSSPNGVNRKNRNLQFAAVATSSVEGSLLPSRLNLDILAPDMVPLHGRSAGHFRAPSKPAQWLRAFSRTIE
jgi:hypothetical protein